jgi:integrase/recombinase XerC
MPKLPEQQFEILSNDDLVKIFSCKYLTATGAQGVRNRALVGLVLASAIRLGEVLSLTPEQIFLSDRLARVTGKGSKTRHVPFSAGTAEALAEWLDIRPAEFATLFDLTQNGTRSLFKRIQRETGVRLWIHLMRHQGATMMARDGMDPLALKRILGHVKLETVMIYVNYNAEDLRAKHDSASPMDKVRQLLPEAQTRPKRRRLSL